MLTTVAIERAKSPETGRRELWDSVVPGLHLRITANGVKTYALMTRLHGRQIRMALGRHGALTLDQARDKARNALDLTARGKDPRSGKRRKPLSDEVSAVVEDFIARYVEPTNRPRSAAETKRALRHRVVPAWRGRSIRDVTRREVIDLLEDIAGVSGANANRTRAAVSKLFAWALDRGIVEASPAARLAAPAPVVERDRVLGDDDLAALWGAFDRLGAPFGPFFKMLLVTGQRRTEVAGLRWDELDGDTWVIPRERYKARRPHLVPLSASAMEILAGLDHNGEFVFTTSGARPISGFSKAKAAADRHAPLAEPWRLHDLRRTCATGIRRLGFGRDVMDAVLGHAMQGVARHYDIYEMADEKRRALDAWGRHVELLTGGAPAANVISLSGMLT